MANINNSDLFKELMRGARLQQNVDRIPNELADKVVPVMEVNPKLLRNTNVIELLTSTTTGITTVLTIPTNKDFYITGWTLNAEKNAACDSTVVSLYGTDENGYSIYFDYWKSFTLTAGTFYKTTILKYPIKLKRGSLIQLDGTFTVGAMNKAVIIQGYTEDNPNA